MPTLFSLTPYDTGHFKTSSYFIFCFFIAEIVTKKRPSPVQKTKGDLLNFLYRASIPTNQRYYFISFYFAISIIFSSGKFANFINSSLRITSCFCSSITFFTFSKVTFFILGHIWLTFT